MNTKWRKLGLALLMVPALGLGQGQKSPVTVMVDNQPVTFNDEQPHMMVGRIMVPLRGVFEKIGAYVEYDAANHLVHAHKLNESVDIRIGDRIARKNGAEIMMEVPAQVINGSTMVPLRFLAESMGAKVRYDQATNTVNVFTTGDGGVWHGG
jgi:hypothetical protein